MASNSGPVRAHYAMATKGLKGDDNFGVQPMSAHSAGGGISGKTKRHLDDGARGAGAPVKHTRGKMPAQAAPDHGDGY